MALMICDSTEPHGGHRWMYLEVHDNYCPGLYDAGDGEWLALPLSKRTQGKHPHFFLTGEPRSICGYGARSADSLTYNPETHLTTVPDPRLGEPAHRRPCGHCIKAVR